MWNASPIMHPVLFHLGSVAIWSHAVFVAVGVTIALAMSWHVAQRRERANRELLWIIAGGLVGGAILARYGLALRYVHDAAQPTLAGLLRYGGRSLLGGLAGAYAGVALTKRLVGYRAHTGDLLVPGVACGIAIGRVGCFLAETPGTATTLPWGVTVRPEYASQLVDCGACRVGTAMHPSFLYESAFLLLAAWWLYRRAVFGAYPARWMADGDLFKLFLLAYATFRFFVEFVRGNPEMAYGLTGSQLTVLPAALLLLFYFVRRFRAYPPNALLSPPPEPSPKP